MRTKNQSRTKPRSCSVGAVSILLTACINPNGMNCTVLQDADKRRRQYIDAINFYLSNTSVPIVFVENSNEDLSPYFTDAIKYKRLECVTFDGNNFDNRRGKGYGEALILLKAWSSSTIRESDYVIKITGRLLINNINCIISQSVRRSRTPLIRVDFYGVSFIPTMVFTFTPRLFIEYLKSHYNEIHDDSCTFECLFYQYAKLKKIHVYPYLASPKIEGFCGGFGNKYEVRPSCVALAYNFKGMWVLSKKRGERIKSYVYYVLFLFFRALCYGDKHIYNNFIIDPRVR